MLSSLVAGRSEASHATEGRINRSAQPGHASRSRRALWVASLAVSEKEPSPSEQAAADAISAVEDLVAEPCYEPNGRDTAPDWRMKLTGERVADVEVTRAADEGTRSLLRCGARQAVACP